MQCIQDYRLPRLKEEGKQGAHRSVAGHVLMPWGRKVSSRKTFAEQTNQSRALLSREQGLFDQGKQERISHCDRCLYVDGLLQGVLEKSKEILIAFP